MVLTKNDYEEEKAYTFSKEQNEERIKKIVALRNRGASLVLPVHVLDIPCEF